MVAYRYLLSAFATAALAVASGVPVPGAYLFEFEDGHVRITWFQVIIEL